MAKRKILFISDHQLSTSGVGTQARYLVSGLISTGKYTFRCFGGAIKHESYEQIAVNDDFIIKPTNGFGDRDMLRLALAQERPDALVLFTDPRFFLHVFEAGDEVHQICPIVYNHLWDNYPWPEYNRVIYEEVDFFNCINWPTYDMVSQRFPEKTNYVPHAVPAELFYPLPAAEAAAARKKLLPGHPDDEFVVLWVSRNARRKMPGDLLHGWKLFLDELEQKHGHRKATLLLHTDPHDAEGPNLLHVAEMLKITNRVVFSAERTEFVQMNHMYNACDAVIACSCAEGFGLSILEGKMCGKPVIAVKTGGLTRQVEDHRTGFQYGVALEPDVKSLVGSQLVPYIYEDTTSSQTIAKGIMKMFEFGPQGRHELGLKALDHARQDYDINRMISEWDRTLEETITKWKTGYKAWEARVF